jgi:NAD(P)-dependent dehydrogenase (short-subunit alcohol dehydrogenase family)
MGLLEHKVVVVTGASRGIGAATAAAAAREGASVVCAARSEEGLSAVVDHIHNVGGVAISVPTDVTDVESVKHMVQVGVERFGRIDGAFNNAGALCGGFLADLAEDDWDAVVAVNLRGTFLCMKYEIRAMLDQESPGSIVNAASIGAHVGVAHVPAYCASKHGVIGLTKSVALEYGERGIRVNSVSPGAVDTEMLVGPGGQDETSEIARAAALRRIGDPVEVARTVVFLLSDHASFITGTDVNVDGGRIR